MFTRHEPRNVLLSIFVTPVGLFCIGIGVLVMQGQVGKGSMIALEFMQLAMGAFFALPERVRRVRVGLRIAWVSSAFLGLGIALSGFRDYRMAVAPVMMVVLVLCFRYLRR